MTSSLSGAPKDIFIHNTGNVSLRVNDEYLGGFVYHNLDDAPHDNLWIAFLGLYFETSSGISFVSGPLYYDGIEVNSDFTLAEALQILDDSTFQRSIVVYSDSISKVNIHQTIYSGREEENWLRMTLDIVNISGTSLRNVKLLFFYDGDVPSIDFYDDYVGRDTSYKSVYIYDPEEEIFTGFCWVEGGTFIGDGSYEYWIDETHHRDRALEILDSPVWVSYSSSDVAVYEVIQVDSLILNGGSREIVLGLFAGNSVGALEDAWISLRADTTYIAETMDHPQRYQISAYPNPFNSKVNIVLPPGLSGELIEIINLNGRVIQTIPISNGIDQYSWDIQSFDQGFMNSGVYLVRIQGNTLSYQAKIVYLK